MLPLLDDVVRSLDPYLEVAFFIALQLQLGHLKVPLWALRARQRIQCWPAIAIIVVIHRILVGDRSCERAIIRDLARLLQEEWWQSNERRLELPRRCDEGCICFSPLDGLLGLFSRGVATLDGALAKLLLPFLADGLWYFAGHSGGWCR